MKKHYYLLLALMLFGISTQNSFGQCTYEITASDSTICAGDSTTLTVQGADNTLLTTLAAGNNHRGNMFNIVATNSVVITAFDAHPMSNTNIEIYYRAGSYVGFEANSAGWTLVGSAAVVAQPTGTVTPVPLNVNVLIPAGQTYAFYVTSSNTAVSLNYTDGTGVGNVYSSDANIQFIEGVGLEYPFTAGGGTFSPRIFNGNIHYELPLEYLWSTGDTTSSINVFPAMNTTYSVLVTDNFNMCNNSDSIDIVVNPLPVIDLGGDTFFCPGDSVVLDAGLPGSDYLWSTGDTTQTISVSIADAFGVTVTGTNGCANYEEVNVSLGVATVADFTVNNSLLVSDFTDNSTDVTAWSWDFGDGNSSTMQNPSHTYATEGTYTVTLIAYGDCGADTTTMDVTVSAVGLTELTLNQSTKVYPNPTNGNFTVELKGVKGDNVNIKVFDLLGNVLYSKSSDSLTSTKVNLDEQVTNGVYFIEITVDATTVSKRIVVSK